jgi:hypothetical protein
MNGGAAGPFPSALVIWTIGGFVHVPSLNVTVNVGFAATPVPELEIATTNAASVPVTDDTDAVLPQPVSDPTSAVVRAVP